MNGNKKKHTTAANAVVVQVHTGTYEHKWFDSNTPPQIEINPKS